MQQTSTNKPRSRLTLDLGLSVLICLATPAIGGQPSQTSSVFDTQQGFLPEDYLQVYPSPAANCAQTKTKAPPMPDTDMKISGSVLDNLKDGQSLVYQSLFSASVGSPYSNDRVNWVGDLRALWVDAAGRWRSDNGDLRLGSLGEDPIVTSCYDESEQRRRFALHVVPHASANVRCNALHYPYADKEIGYLWQASHELARMSHSAASIQRKPFQSSATRRYIRTHIAQQEYDFVANEDFPFQPEWFGVHEEAQAANLINYIRGQENAAFRSRSVDQTLFRMADTLHSQPVVVGKPAANFHLLYEDASYQDFAEQYQQRRSRVFLSSHDGLLHTFNAGWYDADKKQLSKKRPGTGRSTLTEWALGQEMWAFVPFDIFPLLGLFADPGYARQGQKHLSVLSHAPYVFDAQVFGQKGRQHGMEGQPDRTFLASDGQVLSRETHPGGWGTLMVMGFGYGGGAFATKDARGVTQLFQAGYLLFDITDAEQAPKLLANIQHPGFGSTLALPSVLTKRNSRGELQWYLALGSGADLDPLNMQRVSSNQSAKLFIYPLDSLNQTTPAQPVKSIDLGMPESLVSGISAVDWQLNEASDALYITTLGSRSSSVKTRGPSALFRVATTQHHLWEKQKLFAVDAPLAFRPQLSLDALKNRWIYLASGPLAGHDAGILSGQQSIVGLKEVRNTSGAFQMDTGSGHRGRTLALQDLLDVGQLKVHSTSGKLQGKLSMTPTLAQMHVTALEKRLMHYQSAADYLAGWHRPLAKNEYAVAPGQVYGGFLLQPTYQGQQSASSCQPSGQSFMHHLRFTTGTAWYSTGLAGARQTPNKGKPPGSLADTRGKGWRSATLPALLLKLEPDSKQGQLIIFDQHGQSATQQTSLLDAILSQELSWRAL